MENALYIATIIPAGESEDGETPTLIEVCQEVNAIVVWLSSYEGGTEYLRHFYNRNGAIEFAVDEGRRRREEYAKVKKATAAWDSTSAELG